MLGGCLAWTTKAIEERIVEYSSVSEAPSWVAHWLCLLDGLWTCPERNGGGSDLGVEGDFLWRNQRAQVHACIKRSMRRDKASLCSLTKTRIIFRIRKKQISKCWKLVIDPLDSHPLSHNISPWTGGAFGPGDQPPAFRPSDAKLQRLRLGDADGRSLGLIISRWVDGRAIKRYGKHNIRFQTFQTRVWSMEGGSTFGDHSWVPFVDFSQGGWTGLFRELSHHFQPFAAGSIGRNGAFVDRPRPQSRCLRLVSSEDCTGEAADPVPPLLDQKATLRACFWHQVFSSRTVAGNCRFTTKAGGGEASIICGCLKPGQPKT